MVTPMLIKLLFGKFVQCVVNKCVRSPVLWNSDRKVSAVQKLGSVVLQNQCVPNENKVHFWTLM